MAERDLIVIGASAGGVEALTAVVSDLPADLPAAVLIVLHTNPHAPSHLPAILRRASALPAFHPEDCELIRPGRVLVAPPDRHLAVEDSRVRVSRGATENGHRPAVDVLFRTAAKSYGPRVVGVVLTGNLDDGAAGLAMVKRCGGFAVVQDPEEADFPGMPANALLQTAADEVAPLAAIGPLLAGLAGSPLPASAVPPAAPEEAGEPLEPGRPVGVPPPGAPSGYTCPSCGGALWERPDEGPMHFRCRTGHAFSVESLLALQSSALETALWEALRSLEENAALARRLQQRLRNAGSQSVARYERRAMSAEMHAEVLRGILYGEGNEPGNGRES